MKLYLQKNETTQEGHVPIHGVDYHKGLEDGRTCGIPHEFKTKKCVPLLYTEEDVKHDPHPENYVELKYWHPYKKVSGEIL